MWLKNKMAEKDTLDAVNAEVCYNVLIDLKKQKDILGAIYYQTKISFNRKKDGAHLYYSQANPPKYTVVDVDLPEEWKEKNDA